MDKWLWAARFFKTGALAAKACEMGRIESNRVVAKAAREVRVGDLLQVKTEGGHFQVEVLLLSDVRGPAAVAYALGGTSMKGNLCTFRVCGGALIARKAPPLFGELFLGRVVGRFQARDRAIWQFLKPVLKTVVLTT